MTAPERREPAGCGNAEGIPFGTGCSALITQSYLPVLKTGFGPLAQQGHEELMFVAMWSRS